MPTAKVLLPGKMRERRAARETLEDRAELLFASGPGGDYHSPAFMSLRIFRLIKSRFKALKWLR